MYDPLQLEKTKFNKGDVAVLRYDPDYVTIEEVANNFEMVSKILNPIPVIALPYGTYIENMNLEQIKMEIKKLENEIEN